MGVDVNQIIQVRSDRVWSDLAEIFATRYYHWADVLDDVRADDVMVDPCAMLSGFRYGDMLARAATFTNLHAYRNDRVFPDDGDGFVPLKQTPAYILMKGLAKQYGAENVRLVWWKS